MTYRIEDYADREMSRRVVDGGDEVPDMAVDSGRYPAPTGREVAHARHAHDRTLDRYGYDGTWHLTPPAETLRAERLVARALDVASAQRLVRAHGLRVALWDGGVRVSDGPSGTRCTWAELDAAAEQDDTSARETYGAIRTVAYALHEEA